VGNLRNQDSTSAPSTHATNRNPIFATTHWSLVLAARHSDSTTASTALATLCQTYWYPLYSYVRRRGYSPQDAQDLTQEFFARLLQLRWLGQADRQRGRFRTFLLSAMSHFLANEWDKSRAQKRGGGVEIVPLELDSAESRYGKEPADPSTPEQAYERRWAVALLDEVLQRLQRECTAQGKVEWFEALRPCLIGEGGSQPYAVLAQKLRLSESAVKVAVHRLRARFRQLLREEIAKTVVTAADIEDELHYLFAALTGR
jgi:RNA polymerase sigma factor (sigma-70 family)